VDGECWGCGSEDVDRENFYGMLLERDALAVRLCAACQQTKVDEIKAMRAKRLAERDIVQVE
jgi:hypothetical protein